MRMYSQGNLVVPSGRDGLWTRYARHAVGKLGYLCASNPSAIGPCCEPFGSPHAEPALLDRWNRAAVP